MAGGPARALLAVLAFLYGLFHLAIYLFLAIKGGTFFTKATEKQNLELKIARDRLWNLEKRPFGLSHQFLKLRSGFQFHYVTNDVPRTRTVTRPDRPLVILLHGFPDSWAIWRHILQSTDLRESSSLVAVDLPGYGGTDRLKTYSATQVLENLTEFIITIRELYGIGNSENAQSPGRVIIVGHDWGSVLCTRLAADASELADRFVLTNGPITGLVQANILRLFTSATKMFKNFLHSPIRSRSMLTKAWTTVKPALRQAFLSGYIFAFRMPLPMVSYLGTGGNRAWLRGVHANAHGKAETYTSEDAAEAMASTLGPSVDEYKTETSDHLTYSESVRKDGGMGNWMHSTSYYRDDTATAPWSKSLDTIASLHAINRGNDIRRTGSRAGLFDEGPKGSLKAESTFVWGEQDVALDRRICLEGIDEYLTHQSHVVTVPQAGHFTPVETEGRRVLEKVIIWASQGEKEDLGTALKAYSSSAKVTLQT